MNRINLSNKKFPPINEQKIFAFKFDDRVEYVVGKLVYFPEKANSNKLVPCIETKRDLFRAGNYMYWCDLPDL